MAKLLDYERTIESNSNIKKYRSLVKFISLLSNVLWILSILLLVYQTQKNDFSSASTAIWALLVISSIIASRVSKTMSRKLILMAEMAMVEEENTEPEVSNTEKTVPKKAAPKKAALKH